MFRRYKAADALGDEPWTPTVLPFQVLRIGNLAIATIPAEPTTMAGRRVRALLQDSFANEGVEHTICAGYTNDYASYVTTEHEYQLQYYEGSSTLFGHWTLAASLSALQDCVRAMRSETGFWFAEAEPPIFDREMLERRAYRTKGA
jgi:neutral ceramidase